MSSMPKRKGKSQAQQRMVRRQLMRNKRNDIPDAGKDENGIATHTESTNRDGLSITCATISQADSKFRNGGLQCTAMCLEALRRSICKPISLWSSRDIDDAIEEGDGLYNAIVQDAPRMLRVNELPSLFERGGISYYLHIIDEFARTGLIRELPTDDQQGTLSTLTDALRFTFEKAYSVFLIFRNTTVLLIKYGQSYTLFDSHPRTENGLMTESLNGRGVVAKFESLQCLLTYLDTLFDSAYVESEDMFEVTPVKLDILGDLRNIFATTQALSSVTVNVQDVFEQNANNNTPSKTRNDQDEASRSRKRERMKQLYHSDPAGKEKKLERARSEYSSVPATKAKVKERAKQRYHSNPQTRREKIEKAKFRYHSDPVAKASTIDRMKQRYHSDPATKASTIDRIKQMYHSDPVTKANTIDRMKQRYHSDPLTKTKITDRVKQRYHSDPTIKAKTIDRMKNSYHKDDDIKEKTKERAIKRYRTNSNVGAMNNQTKKARYHTDPSFKTILAERSRARYRSDSTIKEQAKKK